VVNDQAWSVEELEGRLGPFFADREPVVDGFGM